MRLKFLIISLLCICGVVMGGQCERCRSDHPEGTGCVFPGVGAPLAASGGNDIKSPWIKAVSEGLRTPFSSKHFQFEEISDWKNEKHLLNFSWLMFASMFSDRLRKKKSITIFKCSISDGPLADESDSALDNASLGESVSERTSLSDIVLSDQVGKEGLTPEWVTVSDSGEHNYKEIIRVLLILDENQEYPTLREKYTSKETFLDGDEGDQEVMHYVQQNNPEIGVLGWSIFPKIDTQEGMNDLFVIPFYSFENNNMLLVFRSLSVSPALYTIVKRKKFKKNLLPALKKIRNSLAEKSSKLSETETLRFFFYEFEKQEFERAYKK